MKSTQALLGKVSQPPSSLMTEGASRKGKINESSEVKGVALNLTHSPENNLSLGACRSFPIWRRPRGECDTDEHRANPPGSKTASSFTTAGK